MAIAALAAPLRREIEARLRSAITQGRFQPGERLIERELCEMLGVSRPPLREALRQLEAEGLLELHPNRGPAVPDISAAEAREIYEARATLEGLATRLFTQRASDTQVKQLRAALRALRKTESGSSERLLDRKNDYYAILFAGCRNRVIARLLMQLHNRVRLVRAQTLAGRTKLALAEIGRIVEAVERRDADAACIAAIAHIDSAVDAAIRSLEQRTKKPAAKASAP